MSPANNHLYAQQKNILKCFRSQPHHIMSNWINITQTITVFHLSPANFCRSKKTKSDPRDLWPLRHLTRVMRGHDLTNKKTITKTNTKTKTMTKTSTFRDHLQRATLETCDLWDIWSEWWGDMTWPTKRQWQRQIQRQRQRHLENTFRERP